MAPGSRLLVFALTWFDPRTVARVFEPLIADYQREYADAPASARRWIRVRGIVAFLVACLAVAPREIVLASIPASTSRRVLARIIIFSSVASMLVTVPMVLQLHDMPAFQLVAAVVALQPTSVVVVFPFAMPWVVDGIRRHSFATPLERVAALRTGVIATLFMTVMLGWGISFTNQQFRTVAAPESSRPPARGVRELTITELLRGTAGLDGRYTRNGSAGAIRRELNNRAVFATLPAVLLWMHWGALRSRRRASVTLSTVIAFVVFFSLYYASVPVEHMLSLGVGTALWMPIMALGLLGAARRAIA